MSTWTCSSPLVSPPNTYMVSIQLKELWSLGVKVLLKPSEESAGTNETGLQEPMRNRCWGYEEKTVMGRGEERF